MSRPNLEEIYGRLETLKRAGSTLYRDDLEALLPYIAELEEERKEMQVRTRPSTSFTTRMGLSSDSRLPPARSGSRPTVTCASSLSPTRCRLGTALSVSRSL